MLINDRLKQLRKSIPAAVGELGETITAAYDHDNYRRREYAQHAALPAAREMKMMAAALLASADAALAILDPPRPEEHHHVHNHPAPRPELLGSISVGSGTR